VRAGVTDLLGGVLIGFKGAGSGAATTGCAGTVLGAVKTFGGGVSALTGSGFGGGGVSALTGSGFGGGGVSALTGSGFGAGFGAGVSIGFDSTFGFGLGLSTRINSIGS